MKLLSWHDTFNRFCEIESINFRKNRFQPNSLIFSSYLQLTSQLYISEIAHPSIRGSLCSANKVASQIGLLASFAMGATFDWRQLALVCAAAPIMLLISAQYVPETPSFLLYTDQESRAEKALQWLRGPDADM